MCSLTCHGMSAGTVVLHVQAWYATDTNGLSCETACPWRHCHLPSQERQSHTTLESHRVHDRRLEIQPRKIFGVKNVLKY